jgi:hypothetical protein
VAEQHEFKVVVAGPFASGKSTLIRAISASAVVGTEQPTSGAEAATKATTTVGMEYGTYSIAEPDLTIDLNLYGVPGQTRFSFMWDIVADGMDGLVLLVDATAPATWAEAAEVGRHFQERCDPPMVVGVNRAALDERRVQDVRGALDGLGAAVVGCDVTDHTSARTVLVELLLLVMERLGDGDRLDDELTGAS